MTDLHMRILRQVARQSQRELSRYDAAEHARGIASIGRREYLARAAKRTRARVTDAEQRRGRRAAGRRDTPDQTITGRDGSTNTPA